MQFELLCLIEKIVEQRYPMFLSTPIGSGATVVTGTFEGTAGTRAFAFDPAVCLACFACRSCSGCRFWPPP